MQVRVVGKCLQQRVVERSDVGYVAREGGPAEWAFAFTEQRPDERRCETGERERILDACEYRLRANVVAVIEDDRPGGLKADHRPNVRAHRLDRTALILHRVLIAQFLCALE